MERTKRIDAEFFRRRHLAIAVQLKKIATESVASVANVSDGNHFSISEDFVEAGIPYYRGQDVVGHFFIEQAVPNYITYEAFDRTYMHRSHLKQGDVLLSIIGTVGETSLVKTESEATCSCKLAILRPRNIPAAYLATYLSSNVGRALSDRWKRGAVQTGLLLEDMDQIPVPRWSPVFESVIAAKVDSAYDALEKSKALLSQAEQSLLAELGLADWSPPEPLTYVRSSADVREAGRVDAQYFNPAKQQVLDTLMAMPGVLLRNRVKHLRDIFDPKKSHMPFQARNFDLPDALQPVLDDDKEVVWSDEVGSTKKLFEPGDVVISRLRAYLREIAVVRTSPEIQAIGSTEFIVLRPPKQGISAETLWVFLRSAPVQTVLKWCVDGSQHPRFSEDDLLNIPVPDAVLKASPMIDTVFQAAMQAKQEARRLLDRAKCAVEIAIENGEAAALRYLEGS